MPRVDRHPHPRHDCAYLTLSIAIVAIIAGCTQEPSTNMPSTGTQRIDWTPVEEGSLSESQGEKHQLLIAARDDLMGTLKGRLLEVMASDGPAGAVGVCSTEAGGLSQEIAKKHAVAIGRTSHKLRNATNRPPPWAEPYVAKRIEEPQLLAGPSGELAALYPIRVGAACLTCHGIAESLDTEVRAILADRYPTDDAVGFAEDDLRGWIWVNTVAAK